LEKVVGIFTVPKALSHLQRNENSQAREKLKANMIKNQTENLNAHVKGREAYAIRTRAGNKEKKEGN
jgi:hypothetical protein